MNEVSDDIMLNIGVALTTHSWVFSTLELPTNKNAGTETRSETVHAHDSAITADNGVRFAA